MIWLKSRIVNLVARHFSTSRLPYHPPIMRATTPSHRPLYELKRIGGIEKEEKEEMQLDEEEEEALAPSAVAPIYYAKHLKIHGHSLRKYPLRSDFLVKGIFSPYSETERAKVPFIYPEGYLIEEAGHPFAYFINTCIRPNGALKTSFEVISRGWRNHSRFFPYATEYDYIFTLYQLWHVYCDPTSPSYLGDIIWPNGKPSVEMIAGVIYDRVRNGLTFGMQVNSRIIDQKLVNRELIDILGFGHMMYHMTPYGFPCGVLSESGFSPCVASSKLVV